MLLDKAKRLPTTPGCYLMKSKNGDVLYVGKAKSLRARVVTYFNSSQKTIKTQALVDKIVDFDFITTGSEAEAFVLESNLIKKYYPRYNIMLKDDKTYPYVFVNHDEPFPRLQYSRNPKRTASCEIFGPFATGSNISKVVKTVRKLFGLRDCTLTDFRSRKNPCLLYQMKLCSAPCCGLISREEYQEKLELVLNIFRGKESESLEYLHQNMKECADNEEFEQAMVIRDNVALLMEFVEIATQKNAELFKGDKNVDIVSFYAGNEEVDVTVCMIRNGLLLGNKNFNFEIMDWEKEIEDGVLSCLYQYYSATADSLPKLLVLSLKQDVAEEVMNQLSIKVRTPGRKFKSLHLLAGENAKHQQSVRLDKKKNLVAGLRKLQELLNLKKRPVVLECFDIAIWQGSSPAASKVVFRNGEADKKSYRYYHMETLPEGNNDFAMMRSLLARRLKHKELPDVFVVDGGKGQVSSFLQVLAELEINVPVVGIAKSKTIKSDDQFQEATVKKSEERLIIPGRSNPYILSKNRNLFGILTQIRDEAHRFSRKLHHKAEKDRLFNSKAKKNS